MGQQIGDQFGNYRLIRLLGSGGFAEVWLGKHQIDHSDVAVKILNVLLPSTEEQDKFLNEARHLAGMDNTHIIKLLDCGIQGDKPFLILEYAPNGTLRQKHPRGSTLPLNLIVNYVKQITMGLQYAHEKRIIHRDIKPENMLLNSKNQVLLSDFGIALPGQTLPYPKTQDIMGTTGYMAPEQLEGHPAFATDQYVLAIVIYEWLCGTLPFKGSPIDIRVQQQNQVAAQLKKVASISPSLEKVLAKALSEQVGDRYHRVQEFADALEQAVNDPNAYSNLPTQNNNAGVVPLPVPVPINSNLLRVAPPDGTILQGGIPLVAPPAANPPVPQPINMAASPFVTPPVQVANPPASPFVAPPASNNASALPSANPLASSASNNILPNSPSNNPYPNPPPINPPSYNQGYSPLPATPAQNPIRLAGQGVTNSFAGVGSPFVAIPNSNTPNQTLHSGPTIAATPQMTSGNPFTPNTTNNTGWQTSKHTTTNHTKWYTPWFNSRFLRESRNQSFFYGGAIVDFVFAVSLGVALTPPSFSDIGWYIGFFSLIGALLFRALCAATKKRVLAIPCAIYLIIYWFMGSWGLATLAHDRTRIEPIPAPIIALTILVIALLLHVNYVLKNKR